MAFRVVSTGLGIVAVAAAVLFAGCSAQSRERWKQFFFDVPEPPPPAAPLPPSQTSVAPLPSVASRTPYASIHPPFARRQCSSCHDPDHARALRRPWPDHCVDCHAKTFKPKRYLHGPFAAVRCMQCHLPHVSARSFLLRRREPDLCLACHGPTLKRNDTYHAESAAKCLPCHDPHNSNRKWMLRPYEMWRNLAPDFAPEVSKAENNVGQ